MAAAATLLWNRDWGAPAVGVDIAPFFSEDARAAVDLLLGDLRRLPFADGAFTRAYSLDVLEHLSPEALRGMLAEANRVLEPGGKLFVYTHVRKNAAIATGLRWINAGARQLERIGLIDMRQERLRKSDHLIRSATSPSSSGPFTRPDFASPASRTTRRSSADSSRTSSCGWPNGRWRGGRRNAPRNPDDEAAGIREARLAAKQRIGRKGPTYAVLQALSAAMKLDLLLFGRIESGPFFALLEKTGEARRPTAA